MPDEAGTAAEKPMASAMSELPACEGLLQISSWAARWAARASGADTVLVWTPDPTHPVLVCTGGSGEGSRATLRTSVAREDPLTRDIPVIVVSARPPADEREAALRFKITAYVSKPFDPEALMDLAERTIS